MTLITSPWFIEAFTKLVVPTTLNSKIPILATQVHPAKKLPSEQKCCASELALDLPWFFMVSDKKRHQGSQHSEIIALFHYCSTTKFIPLKVDLELSRVFSF